MGDYTQLRAPVEAGGASQLINLARRSNITGKILCELAVRQMIVVGRGGAMPTVSPLDPAGRREIVIVWLQSADRAALDALAKGHNMTPEALASLAVRNLLEQARNGVLPMLRPLEPTPTEEEASWETLMLNRNLWDAKHLSNRQDLPEEAPLRPARINLSKALFTVERLHRLANGGLDPDNPRSALDDIGRLKEVPPG